MSASPRPDIASILARSRAIPVLVIEHLEDAVPLAKALCQGGLPVLEVTLRTDVAEDSIAAISEGVPEAIVGAGTILTVSDITAAERAGSRFLVSPGAGPALLEAIAECRTPFLPGIATPSEAMTLLERGIEHMKFFPAEAAGGVSMLRSIGGPLPGLRFCPTGGITPANASDYLALENVLCVGGSWMAPAKLVRAKRWNDIAALAREAAAL
ncbi:MAG: bifunctional 4-hydroxy-2-oxoglutarate aldolase/2-dehydro-3-deoxy-phosphogluconate aldolase [Gemmatimonadetes bacterium]|nr:bifunctional 4-hydroxy-2-oxoglutarate aldolase/2-dehydro-3-deoxy-phosphogluconate aldolase [Gemmatimonadota bacterium]